VAYIFCCLDGFTGLRAGLSPRAYVITPIDFNAVTLTWSYFNAGVNFNGAVRITGATGIYNISSFTYYHSFGFFGRSANVAASLPYAVGNFQGNLQQGCVSVYRSGLVDFGVLFREPDGRPCDARREVRKVEAEGSSRCESKGHCSKGQHDPEKLVNWGINRWAFKPEFGYSEQWGNWLFDAYAGV
jgi:hypothetical protein